MLTARRILTILVVIPVVLVALVALFWYLAYGAEPSPPAEREVSGLTSSTTVTWLPENTAHIEAEAEEDFFRGIGYAHGVQRGWTAVLWRQTALGKLGDWFDEAALPLDSLSRKLGFGVAARSAFESLPDEERDLLRAYAQGMNAALSNREVRQSAHFVLLDHDPDEWEPWHSLSVERLLAWLTAPDMDFPTTRDLPNTAYEFRSANHTLRQWLQVDGFEHSTAWAAADTMGAMLYQRHITGGSALPLYHEIQWGSNEQTLAGATLPGFPAFISGRTDTHAWTILPYTTVTLQEEPYHPDELSTRHERLETFAGDEYLVTIRETASSLMLQPPPETPEEEAARPAPDSPEADEFQDEVPLQDEPEEEAQIDSTWFIHWGGFRAESDLPAWRMLYDQESASFQLISGDGLSMDSTGSISTIGSPVYEDSFAGGILVSQDDWAAYRLEHLQALFEPEGRIRLPDLVDHDSSTWAAQHGRELLASLDSIEVRLDISLEEGDSPTSQAVTYLRNWDFFYSEASISATIFDYWIRTYLEGIGASLVTLHEDDQPVYFEDHRRLVSLRRAVERIVNDFGSDPEDWRWELAAEETRHFPTWSPDTLDIRPGGLLTRTRYAPIHLPGRGHVSSLSWGPSLISEKRTPPTSWESWIHTADWDDLYVRRRYVPIHAVLGRYRFREDRPEAIALPVPADEHASTLLLPQQD